MSYLDLPRINFSGRFFTNVSTVNNRLVNYPPGAPPTILGWNPEGKALFYFDSCVVTGAQAPADDGDLLGAPVTTPKNPVHGKLVDLDQQFQQLSQVIGVQVNLTTDSGAGFTGLLEPCNFQDIWSPQDSTGGSNAGFSQGSCIYVSKLSSVKWTNADDVEVLRLLRDATTDSQLAIRFCINSYFFKDPADPESGFGRMVGTIGPYFQDDPPQFARRRLMPPSNAEAAAAPGHDDAVELQAGFFHLDKQNSRLSLDLLNSVPLANFAGPPKDIGKLRAVVLSQDGSADPIAEPFEFTPDSYKALGGIIDLSLTAEQCQDLSGMQAGVELQQEEGGPWLFMLAEHVVGRYVNISPFTARAVGGESVTFELHAFQWGEPLPGETLDLTAKLPTPAGKPDSLPVNVESGSPVTGPDGRATFTFCTPTVLTVPPLRSELASLAYTVTGPWTKYNGGLMYTNFPPAALLVWEPYADAGMHDPTWEGQVQPVFDEYMRMYPGMKAIMDLSQISVVNANLEKILKAISLPFDAPHRMPVTRDLSPQKIEVIKTWLKIQIAEQNKY